MAYTEFEYVTLFFKILDILQLALLFLYTVELAMPKQTALKSNLICGTKAVYTVPV